MSWDSEAASRVLTVRAGDRRYGIPLASVREIVRDLRPVPLAGAPERVVGLAGFRGEPLAVVSLAALADGVARAGAPGPVVVVDLGDEGSVGLAVDDVAGVQRATPAVGDDQIRPFAAATGPDGPIEVLVIDRIGSAARPGEA